MERWEGRDSKRCELAASARIAESIMRCIRFLYSSRLTVSSQDIACNPNSN